MLTARHPIRLLAPLPWLLIAGSLLGPERPAAAAAEPDLTRALVDTLAAEGLVAVPEEVHWLDAPSGLWSSLFKPRRAALRAHRQGEAADVFLVHVSLTPEGRLRQLTGRFNLTETSAVDERSLTVADHRLAWTIGDERIYSVEFADLAGPSAEETAAWSRFQHFQHALTNLQETGDRAGVARHTIKLDPPATRVTLALVPGEVWIAADGRPIRATTGGTARIIEGGRFAAEQAHHVARPGNVVTWAVDRVRALPWFGSDRMQTVKAIAFAVLDRVDRFRGSVTGDDGSARVAEELGDLLEVPLVDTTDPETGWPPRPLELLMSKPLEGEGRWRLIENDPFVRSNPGAPTPFATTFIRVDRERQFDQIWVTIWDSRQVQLHTMSGTVEPKSATGETGPGLVPRRPEVMGRLLAGLNGGFQAEHGEYGMMAEKVVYLPPKPYAATVTLDEDGTNGFGTWPNDDHVPPHVVSFRQNMTPLVMDGKVNPYQRNWWGGVPEGWTEESRTTRSAICLTEEKFIAYFYGASTDDVHLADAMQRTRCSYGIHLDMNAGHTGLEFYRAGPASEVVPLDRRLDRRWEAEGEVLDMPGWRFRGRRMLRHMGLMNFPRYINRESRDFFYLTLRHILPGEPLATIGDATELDEGSWRVAGLPQHGWPYALTTTWLRPDNARPETKVRLLKLDPRMVKIAEESDPRTELVVAVPSRAATDGSAALFAVPRAFRIGNERPAGATVIVSGARPSEPGVEIPVAAVGIDAGGMLVYAEITTGAGGPEDRALLAGLLTRLGCGEVLLLERPLGAAIGGARDLSDRPAVVPRKSILFIRSEAPGARRNFTDTPVVKPDVWFPLQSRRVRYFKKPKAPGPGAAANPDESPAAKSEE